jgi:hypothetical protein
VTPGFLVCGCAPAAFASSRAQSWGGPVREIRAGDTVWVPPGEKHRHGATPDNSIEHIAMQEQKEGEHVKWLEAVTGGQYSRKPAG